MAIDRLDHYDVVVAGAGISGLLLTRQLARGGMSVLLIDRADRALAGATHRNEGWLHAGTYHSVSVAERSEARTVAGRCQYGWERIVRDYSPAVLPSAHPAVVVVSGESVDIATDRWTDFGVEHRRLNGSGLRELRRSVRISEDEHVFEVQDRSVNTRVLARIILADIERYGGDVMFGCPVNGLDGDRVDIGGRRVRYDRLALATGYSTREACQAVGVESPRIRFWQAHLAVTPRLAPRSVFWIEPDQPASANHGEWTITGGTGEPEDAFPIDEPILVPRAEGAAALKHNIGKRFVTFDESDCTIVSCVKVDTFGQPSDARSLNVFVAWLTESIVSILPGKMTEAPFVTDQLAGTLLASMPMPEVSHRPLDLRRGADG